MGTVQSPPTSVGTPLGHGSADLSPIRQSLLEKNWPSMMPKRSSGDARKMSVGMKVGSKYRGVTHHARTNRYESHIWDGGRQIYLGGFYNEDQAALAYDLAAVKFRGEDANLNFPRGLYSQEMEIRNTVTQEQVVMCMREQSKAMNKVDQNSRSTVSMEPWELQISRMFFFLNEVTYFVVLSSI